MKTDIIYGFGFECSLVNEKHFAEFIRKHKEVLNMSEIEKFMVHVAENAPEHIKECMDELKEYSCDNSGEESVYAFISNVMTRETGINFEYRDSNEDYNQYPVIMFVENVPWLYNSAEKELTRDSLYEIMDRYAKELYLTQDPDYISVEYFEE